ncbi:hypothetical protein J4460_03560 [Candidatus Woesearchaeota archaeon]|nr:MAG: hypothetical protein QS99_C0009G0038 [archaeon GW2011_AR4]MBS3129726.1 hypothetical protein [Candidatus Woesearchaeota archaeon]HIH37419.1 hypothetical protein [Candidatus Woesearchaeota archaeon]HIH48283.1 hypothetical protein [Candidatus Woesearchaeota archaeon]HIJ02892.1 hypothetical protein [Candidatus Woesearchaeota archaeon]
MDPKRREDIVCGITLGALVGSVIEVTEQSPQRIFIRYELRKNGYAAFTGKMTDRYGEHFVARPSPREGTQQYISWSQADTLAQHYPTSFYSWATSALIFAIIGAALGRKINRSLDRLCGME